MLDLQPPRHTSTLPIRDVASNVSNAQMAVVPLRSALMPQGRLITYPSGDSQNYRPFAWSTPELSVVRAISDRLHVVEIRRHGLRRNDEGRQMPCRLPPCRQIITATQARVSDGRAPSCCMSEYRFATPQCSMIFPSCTRMASTASKWILRPVGATPRNVPRCVP
jgi:hypothetical protein